MSSLLNQKRLIWTLLLVLVFSVLSGGCSKEAQLAEAINVTIVLHEIGGEKCRVMLNGETVYNEVPPQMDSSTAINDSLDVELRDGDEIKVTIGSRRVSRTLTVTGDEEFLLISAHYGDYIEISLERFLMLD